MEALFQIGKELGALTARVSTLETKEKCRCGSKGKEVSKGAMSNEVMSNEQREILSQLRKSHKDIFAAINNVLKQFDLGNKIKVSGLRLVDVNVPINPQSDLCCYCCFDGNYCCNGDCTPCCDDKW